MSHLRRLGLRGRLAIALVGSAVLAVGIATLLSNRGLHPRLTEAAEARLQRSAEHMAEVAAAVYREDGGWSAEGAETLEHLARLNRVELRLYGSGGEPIGPGHAHPALLPTTASAPVVIGGRSVGRVVVGPPGGGLLTPEEEHLQVRLDRLHLVAGAVSIVAALLVALLLAQTLSRRLRAIRYLSELPWVPHAIVANRELEWRELDAATVEVATRVGAGHVAVHLHFDADGDIVAASVAARPRMVGKRVIDTPWRGRFGEYEVIGGVRVPTTAEVTWDLPEGPFTYFRGKLTALEVE